MNELKSLAKRQKEDIKHDKQIVSEVSKDIKMDQMVVRTLNSAAKQGMHRDADMPKGTRGKKGAY